MILQRLTRLRPFLQRNAILSRRNLSAADLEEEMQSSTRWGIISLLIAFPSIALAYVNAFVFEPEDHTPPEFVEYEHLRIRSKAFPWGDGDHSLLHNPYTNATTKGFEKQYTHDVHFKLRDLFVKEDET